MSACQDSALALTTFSAAEPSRVRGDILHGPVETLTKGVTVAVASKRELSPVASRLIWFLLGSQVSC